jgi:predicted dehydrogenase
MPLQIAIVGLGFMGATHVRATQKLPSVRLAGVVDSDEKKLSGDLRDVGGNLGVPGELLDFSDVRKFRRLEEALADPAIDAVDICLPTDLHASAAIMALRAGKHVLVEKPIALDAAAGEEVVREAEKSGRILMAGQVLRFLPAYSTAAKLIRSGELGAIRMAWFRRNCARPAWGGWLTNPQRSGGGIFDLLIHDVDYAGWLFGEPASISAVGSGDLISATFHYPGAPVVIEGGWHAQGPYPFSMAFTVAGDLGTLEFSSAGLPLTLSRKNAGASELVETPETDGFEREIGYFAECVAGNRQPEYCPPRESVLAVRLARRMLEDCAKG